MMNLNDIKGIIEINGESYDPRSLLQALIDQGLKIHALNGSLLIGRTFVDPSPGLNYKTDSCPIESHCKIFDKVKHNTLPKQNELNNQAELDSTFPSLDLFSSSKITNDRAYVDKIHVDNNAVDIQDLFSDSSFDNLDSLFEEDDYNMEKDKANRKNTTEMIGISSLTRYGNPSRINYEKIPAKMRGKCHYCSSIVNISWKYCACCGSLMD
jgi:hypothetical protein